MSAIKTLSGMKSYHFDVGNSASGPIGFCARVNAESEDEAVRILRNAMPETNPIIERHMSSVKGIEYLCVYINSNNIGAKDIDSADEMD